MKKYVVVADAARARIFIEEKTELREIDSLTHSESRAHPGDLRTGGDGAVDDSFGQGIRNSDPSVTTMQNESLAFAKEVAEYMRDARTQNKVESFVIVAAPKFLGDLREKLDKPTDKLVIHSLSKDLSKASIDDIQKAVSDMH